jgi:hypothetical protein
VLLDQNTVTHELGLHNCTYLLMGQMKVSRDQTLLAFTLDTTGEEVGGCCCPQPGPGTGHERSSPLNRGLDRSTTCTFET